eukprot:3902713-Pyramimonas_sp.AAC.1
MIDVGISAVYGGRLAAWECRRLDPHPQHPHLHADMGLHGRHQRRHGRHRRGRRHLSRRRKW